MQFGGCPQFWDVAHWLAGGVAIRQSREQPNLQLSTDCVACVATQLLNGARNAPQERQAAPQHTPEQASESYPKKTKELDLYTILQEGHLSCENISHFQ